MNDPYEATDCTGVLKQNADIPTPAWIPTVITGGRTPLPIYPQRSLPTRPRTSRGPGGDWPPEAA